MVGDVRLVDPLAVLERLAHDLGATEIADDAHAVAARVHERRFFVACIGQFKRGKSTLLNALVGARVLPVGVTPVTAVVTVLRHGRSVDARVRIGRDAWRRVEIGELPAYVSELENPENAKNVTGVEVFVPSALLSAGLCLVDTPGIGSVFEGNTEATREFVPHIDAALVVLGADPPISGDELRLVEALSKQVRDFVFVLAKADRNSEEELRQASSFTASILQTTAPDAPVFEVSALERVEHDEPTRDWSRLVDALEALARTRGADLVSAAERRGITRVAASLEHEVGERRAALLRPREESERRLDALRASVKQAERLLADAAPLFEAIERRLAAKLEAEREAFLVGAQTAALAELADAVRAIATGKDAQGRAIEAAQRIARQHVESWRERSAPAAERMYGEAVAELVDSANAVLRRIVESGDPALGSVASAVDVDTRFRVDPHFYFTEILALSGRSVRTALRGAFGGERGRQNALVDHARPYLERLVDTNSARLTNDLIDQIRESRRKVASDIKRLLRGVTSSVERAVSEASAARTRGEPAVTAALAQLDRASASIRASSGANEDLLAARSPRS